ncbi:YifB family Mg chelatase-like AAA ATPase [Paenarthrobacter sp. PH39-S1]|uniref:YifB family Mg chelatase-like AAA ATPase n=1 Tax=Paenarthrobacter sp. PH39-S1 TaxID=3046204 RepID=UPI0024BBB6EE|nr:YifB family Mg chelatase-like AAA ATPase [Paenarthrobacter sp. PH39-S1]MDJ0357080.1 YifB family Mg chelatase-like AAA ATPase [Paenarthrobacter sp. PH39-S1]
MSMGRAFSVALVGLEGHIVEVEADIGQTLPNFVLLGLPDASLNEAKERIRAAAHNSGIPLSRRKITVNLVPASLPKRGSAFDLSIVMAALSAAGDVRGTGRTVFIAELGLDGRLRPVRGILPAVIAAVRAGFSDFAVAAANQGEAALVPGANVTGYQSLARVALDFGARAQELVLERPAEDDALPPVAVAGGAVPGEPDLADVAGQAEARIALEVAAAGGHHLLLVGPPGAGKTMLAERLPGLLPDLDDAEAMEVTAIHSLDGHGQVSALIRRPPYERPHHTASTVAIIGGGSGIPHPGSASRAHHGVLFLDEAPEYERRVLDALRQPLESGELILHRSAGTASYPARFQLVMAANPCPCGKAAGKGQDCTCTAMARRRYFGRLSGPLLDRVDIQLQVNRLSLAELSSTENRESSTVVAARVSLARRRQRQRLAAHGLVRNADVTGRLLRGVFRLPPRTTTVLDRALETGALTARGYDRVLRLAWTLADLAEIDEPGSHEVGLALTMRQRGMSA